MLRIMTIEELAKYLKLHPETIYKKARIGEIPGKKIGREWRFVQSIIDAWLGSDIVFTKEAFQNLRLLTQKQFHEQGLTENDADYIIKETRKGKKRGSKKR